MDENSEDGESEFTDSQGPSGLSPASDLASWRKHFIENRAFSKLERTTESPKLYAITLENIYHSNRGFSKRHELKKKDTKKC